MPRVPCCIGWIACICSRRGFCGEGLSAHSDPCCHCRLWNAYLQSLEKKPTRTKACTSFVGFIIGDILAQQISGTPFNPVRCLRLGAYGLFLDGPIGHQWYRLLDATVFPKDPQGTKAVLTKTALDQLVWAPVMTCVFFAVSAVL